MSKNHVIETARAIRFLHGDDKEIAVHETGLVSVSVSRRTNIDTLSRQEMRELRDFLTKVLSRPMTAEERAKRWKAFGEAIVAEFSDIIESNELMGLFVAARESEGAD